jgi:hypothetical protein
VVAGVLASVGEEGVAGEVEEWLGAAEAMVLGGRCAKLTQEQAVVAGGGSGGNEVLCDSGGCTRGRRRPWCDSRKRRSYLTRLGKKTTFLGGPRPTR